MNRGLFLVACAIVGGAAGTALHLGSRTVHTASSGTDAPASVSAAGAGAAARAADGGGRVDTPVASRPADDATRPPPRPRHSYHDGIMRAAPSVVSLYASLEEAGEGDAPARRLSQGSGVVVDPDGVVLTNLHLVEGARAVNVVLGDGTPLVATLLGSDRETDLAVVRVDTSALDTDLAALSLDAAPPLRVGDVVLAIGNPFGVGQTVTQGIVSATRRRVAGGSAWQDFVQIDAAINPGSSGGALINPDGQLVGVTSAVFRGGAGREGRRGGDAQGIGFAIPAELLARVVPRIIADGRVVRGWLGIGADDLPMFPELHRRVSRGAVITDVLAGGPAAIGGLRRRDIVTHIDGRAVADATGLLLLVSSLDPGTAIGLAIDRDGESLELSATLGERPLPSGFTDDGLAGGALQGETPPAGAPPPR